MEYLNQKIQNDLKRYEKNLDDVNLKADDVTKDYNQTVEENNDLKIEIDKL